MHVMLDLETMSSDSHAAIVAIGAMAFDPMAPITQQHDRNTFCVNVQLAPQQAQGRHIDGKTVMWWLAQSQSAQQALLQPAPLLLKDALLRFSQWYHHEALGQKLWSHSMFDAVILCNAYDACDLSRPFSRLDCMDVRTMYSLAYPAGDPTVPDNNPHEAVWDCYRQILGVQQCYRRLLIDGPGTYHAITNAEAKEALTRIRTGG